MRLTTSKSNLVPPAADDSKPPVKEDLQKLMSGMKQGAWYMCLARRVEAMNL